MHIIHVSVERETEVVDVVLKEAGNILTLLNISGLPIVAAVNEGVIYKRCIVYKQVKLQMQLIINNLNLMVVLNIIFQN